MEILVLGPACDNCVKLLDRMRAVVAEMGVEARLSQVVDPAEWRTYDLLFTPGLVIDGRLVCAGREPAKIELVRWVAAAAGLPEPD